MGDITCTELHPYICVYNNVFFDTDNIYQTIKQSEKNSGKKTTYLNWSKWHIFGTYSYCSLELDQPFFDEDKILKNERNVLKEIRDCRKNVLDLYCKRYDVQLPENSFIDNIMTALKYFPDVDSAQGLGPPSNKTMEYHTDFSVKDAERPGENFLITCNMYFNDDYEGGEIIFSIGKEIISYKPKAGDIIIFPSGSPIFPGDEPYFHAVGVVKNGNKFFSRNFIKYINPGTQEWLDNQKLYGVDEWDRLEKDRSDKANPSLNCMNIDSNGDQVYNHILEKYFRIKK
jgi:hypothetical protein